MTCNRSVLYCAPGTLHDKPTMHKIPLSELKANIIKSLQLQDIDASQIEDDAPLFGTGLGLDSIDALELVVMLEEQYGVVMQDIEENRPAFRSVRTLAEFIEAKQTTECP